MPAPAIHVSQLKKTFHHEGREIAVLNGIDYTLPQGAFHAVMGPSGSGKSTLMCILAGLLSADSGSVVIEGRDLVSMNDAALTAFRRRRIGMVFQNFNLIPTLTTEENIALPALLDGKRLSPARLDELLSRLGLTARRDHMPAQLSGGECQRAAIARAIALSPAVVIADEPTGNLDSPAAKAFCDLLRRMNAEQGCSVLLVSHDPVIAATADRVYLLRDGLLCDSFASAQNPAMVAERYLSMMERP